MNPAKIAIIPEHARLLGCRYSAAAGSINVPHVPAENGKTP
jgi:hypothetical protein